MKKTALFAAVAALFAATPAMAGGYVGAVYGNTDLDGTDSDTWQVEGAFGHSTGSGVGFQAEGSIGQLEGDADTYGYGGHLYWQGAGGWRLGGLLAGANVSDDGSGIEIDEFVYGLEGTFDAGPNTVLGGSATFGTLDLFGTDIDTWNVDANVAFYVSPNFRIGGTIGSGSLDVGTDVDTFTGGLDAEYQFTSLPISITAGYLHFDADTALDTDTFTIGARWNFGGTLRDRDNATPFNVRTPFYGRALDIR